MSSGGLRNFAIMAALVMIAACFTFAAPGLTAADNLETTSVSVTVIMTEIDDDSPVSEFVLGYEKISADKKMYESQGKQVFIYDQGRQPTDPFKMVVLNEMRQYIGNDAFVTPGPDGKMDLDGRQVGFTCPPAEQLAPNSVPASIACTTFESTADTEPVEVVKVTNDANFDLDFLEHMIVFIAEQTTPADESVSELEDSLLEQRMMTSMVSLNAAANEIACADISTQNTNRKQIVHDIFPEGYGDSDSEIPEDIVVEDDETDYAVCDSMHAVFDECELVTGVQTEGSVGEMPTTNETETGFVL